MKCEYSRKGYCPSLYADCVLCMASGYPCYDEVVEAAQRAGDPTKTIVALTERLHIKK